ncbi:MAG: gamma-glutamyltransferase, partial [bacterium]|nr:gamma-glutamyltransferase [bacterium]
MKKVSILVLFSLLLLLTAGFYAKYKTIQTSQSERKMKWTKRSVVVGTRGIVATSQPLAAQAGLDILKKGGNAIDAAVATAAVLNVVEHGSTGIGGDAFVMIYMAKDKKLAGLNASGRAPGNLTREKVAELGHRRMPSSGMLPVTVPGAFDGWVTVLAKYGTMDLDEVLEQAIYYAENGFPVSEIIAGQWEGALNKLKGHPLTASTFLVDGERAPKTGEIFVQENLAETFRKLARGGRDEFYKGSIAREIVKFSEENGGFLTMEDFEKHTSTWVEPIYADYKNYRLYELPPNGQGIAALEMLNILENVDLKPLGHNSAEYLHYLIEAKKLAYADIRQWVADPEFEDLPV